MSNVPPPRSPPPRQHKGLGRTSSNASSSSLKSLRFTRSSSSMVGKSFRSNLSSKDSARMSVRLQKAAVATKHVWVADSETGDWNLCKVISQDNSMMTLQNMTTGARFSYDTAFGEVFQANDGIYPDMTYLRHLHEAAILHNLRERLNAREPYTFMGSVLISVNPFEWLENPDPGTFAGKAMESDRPHPYAIAEMSIQQICVKKPKDQSVVISGESGAGKTESAKMVLNYLVSRATGKFDASTASGSSIERRLVESSPVLESFGNAKTARNSNSSRFGKYLKIFFQPKQNHESTHSLLETRQIAGAAVETYLLEKSRVVGHAPNEKNYHIFYQLLNAKAANHPTLAQCPLSSSTVSDYRILGSIEDLASNRKTVRQASMSETNTVDSFVEVENALRVLQMSEANILSVWNTLAAILEIGNILFVDEESPQGTVAKVENFEQCRLSAGLLNVTPESLQATLTQRVMTARGESYTISLNSKDAQNARNAICKAMYSAVFSSLVDVINAALTENMTSMDSSHFNSIGVLDIFGFEAFQHNEFEQLLINYANEELQSAFNRHVFQNELRLYQEENISSDLTVDQCPNNSGCVTLLSGPKISVLAALQSSSQMANASDELFFETINKSFDGITDLELKSFFVKAHPKDRKGMFTIKHFAGKVSYHIGAKGTNTWLLKNNDDVPQDLTTMLQGSNDEMVRNYVLTLQAQAPQAPSGGRRSSLRKQSIADGFVLSMASLVKTLNESTCSFIRCIKPNAELRPMTFNNLYSLEQVRALGLVQVCAVMKIGLPTRISFPELKEALGPVAKEVEQLFEGHPEETLIASLLYAFNIPQDVYQLGRTKLFFKSGQLDALDRILSTDFEAQKDDIMNRLQAALTARRDCEAAVVTINSSYKELQTFYETTQQSVTDLSTSLMEVREKVVKAFTKDYQSISNSTEKVLNILNTLTCDITDVTTYGQDVESHEDYAPIKKQIGEVQERLNLSELQWKVLDERLLEIEAFCTDPNNAMYELCAERSDELPRIESEVADAHELVHLVELEANRCDVAKVQQKSEDAEHEMSLIRFHLKKLQSGVVDIEKMRGQTISTVEYLKLHMQDVKKFVLESGSLGSSITGSCQEIRRAIDELRAKVAKDLEEKRRMEEEARRREEEEKRKREEEERAILAELERQRVEAEQAAALAAAEEEAKRILKEQHREVIESRRSSGGMGFDSDDELDPDTISELASHIAQGHDFDELPEGWEKKVDPATNVTYYVNTITETSQWSRPSSPAGNHLEEHHEEKVKVIDDERKLFDSLSLMSHDGIDSSHTSLRKRVPLEHADRVESFISTDNDQEEQEEAEEKDDAPVEMTDIQPHLPLPASAATPTAAAVTPQPEPEPEHPSRKGILQKQGGLFGMWSKKFFLLEEGVLSYYETSQSYLSGARPTKQMLITGSTELSYTKMSHCFKIKTDSVEFILMSENKDHMREWIADLRTIITSEYDARIKALMSNKKK